ncbi:GDSL-type esterase/lipase family protein [Streptomyces sp. SID7909]|uniref:GDSL-type esterase/lipase family protein n=1 Tax=Streptomyces sp. SID7909 TaxID=2706092 RepID=UPI001EF26519|nr:GDSL-type esterase/lipase family protein [Streptomyces sp. SID7909]
MRRSTLTRLRAAAASAAAFAVAVGIGLPQASADSPPPRAADGWSAETEAALSDDGAAKDAQPAFKPSAVAKDRRAAVLGADYAASSDRAFTTSGDATGFHVMVAEEKNGYGWRTAATLSEAGFDTDTWIGNACVTESGRYAAVAYAPRTFTNKPELMSRGAFTAIVDLDTGSVRKLPFQATMGYFSPGCGSGEEAVFSQFTDEVSSAASETRLITVAAPSGTTHKARVGGQITSAVPAAGGHIVAAQGHRIVRIDGRKVRVVARTHGVPFQLKPDADGGVTFIDRLPGAAGAPAQADAESEAAVSRVTAAQLRSPAAKNTAQSLAKGKLTAFDLARAADGTVFVTGTARSDPGRKLPGSVRNPGGIAKDARVSSHGRAALTTAWVDGKDSRISPGDALAARPARVTMTVLDTDRSVTLDAMPQERVGSAKAQDTSLAASPALPRSVQAKAESSKSATASPVESDRTCSVPRGDVKLQAYQPTPRQIEWAVDQAVVSNLNAKASRPADWRNTGMPAYSPQSLFPLSPLSGGTGSDWRIPAQILLGVTAQESNMWQATRYAVPGVSANPLIGNYYGVSYASDGEQGDPWAINWAEADCGYGVTQVTDGMRLPGKGQPTLSETQQRAVAVDYAANIAAGADILADKWNQTRADGLVVNNGEPKWMENWFYALWAYNSGYYPKAEAATKSGKWGVGWTNNPANPLWKENRLPFLEASNGDDDYSHASHPQDWPYQEKVIGWAARPISAMFRPGDYQPGYRQATWNQVEYRTMAKPPVSLFCDTTNDCDPSRIDEGATNDTGGGPCLLPGDSSDPLYLKCWYHQPVTWKECGSAMRACGYPLHRFNTTYPEQDDPNPPVYPPRCSAELPAGTLIIDDVADGVTPTGASTATSTGPPPRSCGAVTSKAGTFGFDFPDPSGRMDLHQIGAGHENHFWFSHTYRQYGTEAPRTKVTGTWTLGTANRGWMRVWVHLPDHGAHTRQALYTVSGTDSTSPQRAKPQRVMSNKWVSLGVFNFTGTPQVSLSNITKDGNGTEDIAWDAAGFEPLDRKPAHQIVTMGDSYASGEGVTEGPGGVDYYPESDYYDGRTEATKNSCHRSTKAWSRQATLPGTATSIGARADAMDPALDFQFVACSGARHYHILGEGQNGELGQIEQGYLDQHTTMVALSIGGNDMRFADVVASCINPLVLDCRSTSLAAVDPSTGEKLSYETGPLSQWAPEWAHEIIRPRLSGMLRTIQEQAPNARIVLMGYPRLLSLDACLDLITGDEKVWLNHLADMVADEMAGAVDDANTRFGTNAVFSDPRDEFAGKGICGNPEGLHGIVLTGHSQADSRPNSMKSFHPTVVGARLYADSLEQTLSGS